MGTERAGLGVRPEWAEGGARPGKEEAWLEGWAGGVAFCERIWAGPDLKLTGRCGFVAVIGGLRRGEVLRLWAWRRNAGLLVKGSLALGLEGWGEGLVPDPGGCALGSGKDVGSHRGQREDRQASSCN